MKIIKKVHSENKETSCILRCEKGEYRLTISVSCGENWANEYFAITRKEDALRRMDVICGDIVERNGELFSSRLNGRALAQPCKDCGAGCYNNFCDECSRKRKEESFCFDPRKYVDAAIARGEAVHMFFTYDGNKIGHNRIPSWDWVAERFAQAGSWLRFLFITTEGKTYAEDYFSDWL